MRLSVISDTLLKIERVSSIDKKIALLSALLKKIPAKDIGFSSLMLIGEVVAENSSEKMNFAQQLLIRSVARLTKKNMSSVSAIAKDQGDIGLACQKLIGPKKRSVLTTADVEKSINKVIKQSGKGSVEKKIEEFYELLKKGSGLDCRYLCRLAQGNLRVGVSKHLMFEALAEAFTRDRKNKRKIESAYSADADMGKLAHILKTSGISGLNSRPREIGRPIRPMLAKRADSLKQIKEKMDVIAAEEKLDGERIQAHKNKKEVRLFSRRLEDVSHQYPDVIDAVISNIKAERCILDGEVVAIDGKGHLLSFQHLMQRKRKHGIADYVKKIPVRYIVFDLLYLKDEYLKERPYLKRRRLLEKIVKKSKRIDIAKQIRSKDISKVKKFFEACCKKGREGIIAKSAADDSVYRAGSRGWLWIKWKKDYVRGLHDSFDVVIVGAYKGKGKRRGTYGALLCAVYDKKMKRFQTLTRLGTGLKDAQLKALPKKLRRFERKNRPEDVEVRKDMIPDIWFSPEQVIEIEGAELTKSSSHTCAQKEGKGLSLRFPRFVRFRDDKSAKDATTVKEVLEMKR